MSCVVNVNVDTEHVLDAGVLEGRARTKEEYARAVPFPHCVLRPLFRDEFLAAVRAEVLQLPRTFKETDLFKLYQSVDLANMDATTDAARALPALMRFKQTLYSQAFREFVADITGCGPLTEKVDCAASVYVAGSHLLAHDDVIGTRAVAYIVYLTDPGPASGAAAWQAEDGGQLELYPCASPGEPLPMPSKTILPLWNSMGIFTVLPGRSFHAVQEVLSQTKERLSIQGWFHRASPPEGAENTEATLQTFKRIVDRVQGPFLPIPGASAALTDAPQLGEADKLFLLQQGVNPVYLHEKTLAALRAHMSMTGSVRLVQFLAPSLADRITSLVVAEDATSKTNQTLLPSSNNWELVGPPHLQRLVRLKQQAPAAPADGKLELSELDAALAKLGALARSSSFAAFVSLLTGQPLVNCRSFVRRFRPGLDYTLATVPDPCLMVDASLCFVDERCRDNSVTATEAVAGDSEASWESGEIGGFECYIAAQADDNPEVAHYASKPKRTKPADSDEKKEGEEEDREEDGEDGEDGEEDTMTVPACSNSLSISLRRPNQMRFVKFVSARAPGSRWDVFTEYQVQEDR
jgi:prolyl 3-hydroxylase /prolyl 3,4-dihydroxylase